MAGFVPALVLSVLAGLATAVGGVAGVCMRGDGRRVLSFALGLAAGVMVCVSFVELLPESRELLTGRLGAQWGSAAAFLSLLAGAGAAFALERLLPTPKPAGHGQGQGAASLTRVGVVTAVALTLHNFPEGIATFMAGYSDLRVGLPVAFSIALHNIPEGIAVAVPVCYGTGKRARAVGAAAASGLSEPLGAVAAFALLAPLLTPALLGGIYGFVAGVMIALSFDELIPTAESYGHLMLALLGILAGTAVMAVTMALLG